MSTETSPPPDGDPARYHEEVPGGHLDLTGNPLRLERTIPARKLPVLRAKRTAMFQPAATYVDGLRVLGRQDTIDSLTWDMTDACLQHSVLSRADLFYATPEFCRLLAGAFQTLDISGAWEAPGPPRVTDAATFSMDGLLYLAEPIHLDRPKGDDSEVGGMSVRMLSWMLTPDPDDPDKGYLAMWCSGLADRGPFGGAEAVSRNIAVMDRNAPETVTWKGHPEHEPARLVFAAWALLNQEGLTESATRTPAPPQARSKARKRRAELDQTPVTVVDLRRAARDRQAAVEGAAQSRFHSRWIVRGHWREQACGKGRADRRRIYVEPHYKGPADAPLVLRERVYQW